MRLARWLSRRPRPVRVPESKDERRIRIKVERDNRLARERASE